MKKVFMILGLVATSLLLKAQIKLDELEEKKKKKLEPKLSIRGAINFSTIGGESDSYNGMLPGAQFGIGTPVVKLSRNIAVYAEANYSMQGGKYEESGYTAPGDGGGGGYNVGATSGKAKLSYINVPVVARYQNPGGFYAELGVQPGILVSAKDKVNGTSYNFKDQVNTFDLGVVGGVGCQFNNHIGVGVRATPGLTNINKKRFGYNVNKDRNFVLSLGAAYTL